MKKYIKLISVAVVLVGLIVGAVALYDKLSENYDPYDDSEFTENTADTASETDATIETDIETSPTETTPVELQAPDFTMYDMAGNKVSLSDFAGKPIVINFWATWCGPCKNEMPYFQNMYDKYGDRVTFVMLNATDGDRDTVEKVKQFIADNGYTFPVYCDMDMSGIMTYGVYAFPSTLIIKADGTVYAGQVGALTQSQLENAIKKVLN